MYDEKEIKQFAKKARITVAKILNKTNDSHIGGGYSSIDIMSVLYNSILNIDVNHLDDPNRDVFILSKGHIAASFYSVLYLKGFITQEQLSEYIQNGSRYAGHTRKYNTLGVPGVEMSAGSLGHGANVGAGMAYAKRIMGYSGNVYVLMGDGECNEGSVWEAAMFASKFQLSNLVFVIDHNRLQAYGREKDVMDMGCLAEKFKAFGCDSVVVDGHNIPELYRVLSMATSKNPASPKVIDAETVKGKGASFMENRIEWHFKSPNDEQLRMIIEEQEML